MTAISIPKLSQTESRRLEREGGVEFVDGQVVEKPVSVESSRVAARVLGILLNDADGSGEAEVFDSSLGYKVFQDDPERFRKPDISVIRADRMVGIEPADGFMRIPADLVIEVLSPGDLAYDVIEKVDEYLRHGFRLVWLVHPNTHSVTVYRAGGNATLLHEHEVITGENVMPSFRHEVADFFARTARIANSP